jgi:hypothetical protein
MTDHRSLTTFHRPKEDAEWYASVMLNRLMFVYFIQKKGFLANELDYLRRRLKTCQQEQGKDKFQTFYRYFLLRLFHEGFGRRRKGRAPDLEKLLGNIPYLNGGLFDVHELEKTLSPTTKTKAVAYIQSAPPTTMTAFRRAFLRGTIPADFQNEVN